MLRNGTRPEATAAEMTCGCGCGGGGEGGQARGSYAGRRARNPGAGDTAGEMLQWLEGTLSVRAAMAGCTECK